jgi:hypothetical protein
MNAENKNQDLTTEDVEGHRTAADQVEGLVKDDVDDVSGHVQPRRDLDIER